jgi:hypothetical protein
LFVDYTYANIGQLRTAIGVTFNGEKKDESPRRIIRTLAYHLDFKAGKFTDRPVE